MINQMKEDLLKAKSIGQLTNIVHEAPALTEEENKSFMDTDYQPAEISINKKSWVKWKTVSDKLRDSLG